MSIINIKYSSSLLFASAFMTMQSICAQESLKISVHNPLKFDRQEVVSIKRNNLEKFLKGKEEQDVRIVSKMDKKTQQLQWIDNDQDGRSDELLFYVKIDASASAEYLIVADKLIPQSTETAKTFSRFVPERTDDYAWENDKVAFRTYGPDAQKRTEEHRENGTLSSGIDLWLKRTDKLVINSWYKGYETNPMYYHSDRGEGYDPYHVGGSRGTGGTGIWQKDSLLVSKNFVTYKTITTGPLRTIFELVYNPYSSYEVKETKRISLDAGSNFSKFEISYSSKTPLPNYTIGISLHDNAGSAELFKDKGYVVHLEKMDGVYLGEGLIFSPKDIRDIIIHKTKAKDQSNLLVVTNPVGKITYLAGFAWGKGGQAANKKEWNEMMKKQTEIIANPLLVKVSK